MQTLEFLGHRSFPSRVGIIMLAKCDDGPAKIRQLGKGQRVEAKRSSTGFTFPFWRAKAGE
jgi:hypothetical protein